jgi:hypothetical protein
MAMNYKVIEIGGAFVVEEKETNQIIETFDEYSEAKKYMKFLNLGGGFDGFTPSFILNNSSKNM